ncbi:hypothetical protein HMPREF1550_00520 [Actinomyces sp. oral taxon 877 str. F0543]|nr:hypothetical protein HMPREF1550_00520 [Actinomyces sp. oral taxon 877 str. F0543]
MSGAAFHGFPAPRSWRRRGAGVLLIPAHFSAPRSRRRPAGGAVRVLSHSGRAASIVSGEGRWAVFFLSGV